MGRYFPLHWRQFVTICSARQPSILKMVRKTIPGQTALSMNFHELPNKASSPVIDIPKILFAYFNTNLYQRAFGCKVTKVYTAGSRSAVVKTSLHICTLTLEVEIMASHGVP